MTLDIQFKLKSNPLYKQYLRQHSSWYRLLTRNPNLYKEFEEEVKDFYKLRPTDRINQMLDTIELLQTFMTSFK